LSCSHLHTKPWAVEQGICCCGLLTKWISMGFIGKPPEWLSTCTGGNRGLPPALCHMKFLCCIKCINCMSVRCFKAVLLTVLLMKQSEET
jgi:hypothetical protein